MKKHVPHVCISACPQNVLSVLRTQRTSKISFQFATDDSKATVVVHCETGLCKTYTLPLMETEVVHAMADKTSLPVILVAETMAMSR
jgi:Rad9